MDVTTIRISNENKTFVKETKMNLSQYVNTKLDEERLSEADGLKKEIKKRQQDIIELESRLKDIKGRKAAIKENGRKTKSMSANEVDREAKNLLDNYGEAFEVKTKWGQTPWGSYENELIIARANKLIEEGYLKEVE